MYLPRGTFLLASTLFAFSTALPVADSSAALPALFSNITIFDPPSNYTIPRTLYARTLLLEHQPNQPPSYSSDGDYTLLATWENYLPDNDTFPYFPIFQSLDKGVTWTERTRVYDQVNGWGLRYQPFLYELPDSIGGFAKGTILLAGNSIPDDLSKTQIDLYASTDEGHTFTFVSHIASGGEALPDNGLTPVWEPFLMFYRNQLICYYSDQRNPLHGQQLSHQVSSDLKTWGPVVIDVAYSNYTFRPGMTTVSLLPNGSYFMTYEFYGAPQAAFAVYYRLNENPLAFNSSPGNALIARNGGTVPVSSPYNVWTPYGGTYGTIVVSCGTLSSIFVNTELGNPDSWVEVATSEGISYTRTLKVLPDDQRVLITGAGILGGEENRVTTTKFQLSS